MKVSKLTTEPRLETYNNRGLKIQTFGEFNDQPQRYAELVAASATGNTCVDVYRKFINGRGFANEDFAKHVVDGKGTTANQLLQALADDYAHFGGFAIHVNYNGLYAPISASHVPMETIRFEELDKQCRFNQLAVHPDWGRRFTKLRAFKESDIDRFHFFNPDPEVIAKEVEEAGGWNGYKGQILYYSNQGDKVYPSPLYEAVTTDMSNEEGLSNITQRNVRSGYLLSGMFVDCDQSDNSEEQIEQKKKELSEFQGDQKAGVLMYVNVKNGDEAPKFIPFKTNNYDKDFVQAEQKTPEIIGKAFTQPPILRAEDVGANFGADLMKQGYDFYNTITETERTTISEQVKRIFDLWCDPMINPQGDYEILPKVYQVTASLAERLGDHVDKVLELIFDTTKTPTQKRVVLKTVFNVEDKDINELMNGLR